VRITEVMTEQVVTAPRDASVQAVAELMRDHNVGSVVICEGDRPHALVTDRDVALALGAEGIERATPVSDFDSRPLVTGHVDMDVEEAAARMVQHRVRRLPLVDGEQLAGIVTLDDLAVRTGDLKLAQQMTEEVRKAALPEFFFHQRGG
jgi:CBS domain-containing protein